MAGRPWCTAASERARSYVLWTGRGHKSKRPELLLELARALPDERFVMAVADALDRLAVLK